MAQTGYTPILIYASGTTGNTPSASNLTSSASGAELALNYFDGRLFYKDASGNVQVLAGKGGSGVVAGSNTQVQFNNNGVFGASANMTFNGTRLTVADLADSGLTSGRVVYASTGGALVDSANLTFDGTLLTTTSAAIGGTLGMTVGGALNGTTINSVGINLGGTQTLSINAGTANGVAFLNGSKVLSTGSALTFDGLNLGLNTGAAVNIGGNVSLYGDANQTVIRGRVTNGTIFQGSDGSEQMRLTSSLLSVVPGATIQGLTVGRGAGAVSTNTAVGASALAANTSGATNTAIGQLSLLSNTSGGSNAAVGRAALALNTTGNFNAAFGHTALYSNTTGNFNTAQGGDALYFNTTASNNTAVGYQAAFNNTTGANNAALGYLAGYNTTTGAGNTYIGVQAAVAATTASNNTFVGSFSGPVLSAATGVGNTGLGQAAGASLTTGTYNTFVGAAGQVNQGAGGLITTGSKNSIFGAYNGNQGGLDIRTGNNNIVLSDGDGNPMMWGTGQTEWLMRSGSGLWTLFSNGGGNNSTYNGTLIGANKGSLAGQANASLPSWFIDIGGRAADGTTRPVATADKFSVGRQAAGGTLIGAANLFEVNANGAIGLNTTAASTGTGITFPATQNASSDANTLDDYEEGTFTPTLTSSIPPTGVTYNHQIGRYIKVGRAVHIEISLAMASVGSGGSGTTFVAGLPFTSANVSEAYPNFGIAVAPLSSAVAGQISGQVNFNDSKVTLVRNTNTTLALDAIPYGNMTSSTQIRMAFTYFVTA